MTYRVRRSESAFEPLVMNQQQYTDAYCNNHWQNATNSPTQKNLNELTEASAPTNLLGQCNKEYATDQDGHR